MTAISPQHPQIDQPFFDKKTGSIVLVSVLALHGILAVGLANMTIPEIRPPKVTPPLEISFVTPPPPVEVKPEDIKIEPEPKPIEKPIEPKVKPVVTPEPEPKVEKKVEPKPVQEPPKTVEKPIEQPVKKTVEKPIQEPVKEPIKEPEKPVVKQPEPDQNLIKAQQLAAENERAEREQKEQQDRQKEQERQQALVKQEQERQQELARQRALADQQDQAKKQAEAETARRKADEATKQKALDDAKAKKDAADKAQKAKEDAQKAAQSNTPVTFSAGQASWRSKPNFSCNNETPGEVLTASFRYVADKQGNATVTQTKSTGNAKVDKQLLMQAKTGKFNPFTKNGVPVVGILILPVRCQ